MILSCLVSLLLLTSVYCNEKKITEISQDKMITALNKVFESTIGPMINPSIPKKSYRDIFYIQKEAPFTSEHIPDSLIFSEGTKSVPKLFCKLKKNITTKELTAKMKEKLLIILKKAKYVSFTKLIEENGALLYSLSNSLQDLTDCQRFIASAKPVYKEGTELLKLITKSKEECKEEMPKLIEMLKKKRTTDPKFMNHVYEMEKGFEIIVKSDFDWLSDKSLFANNANILKYKLGSDPFIRSKWSQTIESYNNWITHLTTMNSFIGKRLGLLFTQFPDILQEPIYFRPDYNGVNNCMVEIKRHLDRLGAEYAGVDKKESIMFEGKPAYMLIEKYGSFEQYLQHLAFSMSKELFEDDKILDMFVPSKTAGILSVTGTIISIVLCTLFTMGLAFLLYKYVYLKDTTSMYNYTPKFTGN